MNSDKCKLILNQVVDTRRFVIWKVEKIYVLDICSLDHDAEYILKNTSADAFLSTDEKQVYDELKTKLTQNESNIDKTLNLLEELRLLFWR